MTVQFTSRLLIVVLALLLLCPVTPTSGRQHRGEGGGGGNCTVSISPEYVSIGSAANTIQITVNADDMYCSWEVTTDVSWITASPTSGSGPGTVTLNIAAAPSTQYCLPRGGLCQINTARVTISQSGHLYSDCVGGSSGVGGDNCCATKAASLVSHGGDSLALARRYRDEVLLRSPRGAEYVRAYYEHTHEAVQIASSDPWLLLRTARALKRHTSNLQKAVDNGKAEVTVEDLAEFDALASEYEAAAKPALRAKLAAFRRDLHEPERLASVGVLVVPAGSGHVDKRVGGDAFDGFEERLIGLAPASAGTATRILRVPDLLAAAARTRRYSRWFERHASNVIKAITSDPALALRFGITASRLMTSLDSLVETGSARVDQSSLDDLAEILDRVASRLDPSAAETIRLAKRDLRSRHILAAHGVSVDRNRFAYSIVPARVENVAGGTAGPSGFLGGSGDDIASATAVDSAGNVIVVGATAGGGFPVVNAVQSQYQGEGDAFVTKIAPDGQVVFSTYLGGSRADVASAVATDAAGNIYVCGTTESTNFPVPGGYQRARRGGADAFVIKLDPSGSTVVYGTYLGGTSLDGATAIAVDADGRAYVAGATTSLDFPLTAGVVDRSMTGLVDAFVSRLSATGTTLEASTMLGGQGREGASSIGVDAAGNVVVAGVTSSLDFPQIRPIQSEFGGACDGFVTKLNAGLTSFVYSSWLGGSDVDGVGGLAVEPGGAVVLTGATASSTDFPMRAAAQATYGGGFLDAFVTRIPATAGGLDFSTFLGGLDDDRGYRVVTDGVGGVSIAGITASANFPTVSPAQATFGGGTFDAFVAQFAPNGSSIRMSSFIGGNADEAGVGLAVLPTGAIVAVGETSSPNFPASGVFGAFEGGPSDGFIVSIGGATQVPPPVVDRVDGLTQSGKPFRIKIVGSNFQSGALVYVGQRTEPWASVKRKGDTQLLLRKGAALEAVFPAGVATDIRIVNPDGGVATVTFTR